MNREIFGNPVNSITNKYVREIYVRTNQEISQTIIEITKITDYLNYFKPVRYNRTNHNIKKEYLQAYLQGLKKAVNIILSVEKDLNK